MNFLFMATVLDYLADIWRAKKNTGRPNEVEMVDFPKSLGVLRQERKDEFAVAAIAGRIGTVCGGRGILRFLEKGLAPVATQGTDQRSPQLEQLLLLRVQELVKRPTFSTPPTDGALINRGRVVLPRESK